VIEDLEFRASSRFFYIPRNEGFFWVSRLARPFSPSPFRTRLQQGFGGGVGFPLLIESDFACEPSSRADSPFLLECRFVPLFLNPFFSPPQIEGLADSIFPDSALLSPLSFFLKPAFGPKKVMTPPAHPYLSNPLFFFLNPRLSDRPTAHGRHA